MTLHATSPKRKEKNKWNKILNWGSKIMKRDLNEFVKIVHLMLKGIWDGKHYWYFPKPIKVETHPNPTGRRK
jgi:hypothetical protein